MRTSPLDFVDGISTWIDYLAIDVYRKYGEYACRGALGQAHDFYRIGQQENIFIYIYIING